MASTPTIESGPCGPTTRPLTEGELRASALACLLASEPAPKTAAVADMARSWKEGRLRLPPDVVLTTTGAIPGRPERPELVPPRLVGRRSMATVEGRAMLIHALAHIEFNAVNLARDAMWRFDRMPQAFYID